LVKKKAKTSERVSMGPTEFPAIAMGNNRKNEVRSKYCAVEEGKTKGYCQFKPGRSDHKPARRL
jgi:hypothetical protein